jgi:hypothetical protein
LQYKIADIARMMGGVLLVKGKTSTLFSKINSWLHYATATLASNLVSEAHFQDAPGNWLVIRRCIERRNPQCVSPHARECAL